MASALGGAAGGAGSAMGPWGKAIRAGVGLLGSFFGGRKAAKQRRKMNRYLNTQDAENNHTLETRNISQSCTGPVLCQSPGIYA